MNGKARHESLGPAWKMYATSTTVKPDTIILHSWADEVVQFSDSEELVRNSGLPAWTLIEVGSDHQLDDPESLETLLEACLIGDEDEGDEGVAVDEEAGDILEHDWTGLCYTAALRWVADNRDWVVVHGTVWSGEEDRRIEHAWCERGELVADLAMPAGARLVKRGTYYRVIKPEVSKVYSPDDALLLAIRNGHDGPWGEDEQLKEK